ncbi:aspartate kinase [Candidatus Woesearchaeota archaeon]|mgnify:CR=1 FL=1|nr:aspartate kinase [Candidatus Woesearchaeota archaeon]|tara:strand:+ start:3829 stop:4464 length:636 start_codon:yes stop_codon:yes gene_type:complete
MVNITKLAEHYIAEHPFVKDCLKKGLINYSSLTRQICKDCSLDIKKNFDAVLIACRRYYNKIKSEATTEKKILEILKNSKIEVKNKINALVLEKNIYFPNLIDIEKEAKKLNETFHIIEGASAITIIASEDFATKIKKTFKTKIKKENKNLVEAILKSPKQIETTAGVVSYLYSLLGENGINIYETLSCWTDTIFLVDEKDLSKVMELLRF